MATREERHRQRGGAACARMLRVPAVSCCRCPAFPWPTTPEDYTQPSHKPQRLTQNHQPPAVPSRRFHTTLLQIPTIDPVPPTSGHTPKRSVHTDKADKDDYCILCSIKARILRCGHNSATTDRPDATQDQKGSGTTSSSPEGRKSTVAHPQGHIEGTAAQGANQPTTKRESAIWLSIFNADISTDRLPPHLECSGADVAVCGGQLKLIRNLICNLVGRVFVRIVSKVYGPPMPAAIKPCLRSDKCVGFQTPGRSLLTHFSTLVMNMCIAYMRQASHPAQACMHLGVWHGVTKVCTAVPESCRLGPLPLVRGLFRLVLLALRVISHVLHVEPEVQPPLLHAPRELKIVVLSPHRANLQFTSKTNVSKGLLDISKT